MRDIVLDFIKSKNKSMNILEISRKLDLPLKDIEYALDSLIEDNEVYLNDKKNIVLFERANFVKATIKTINEIFSFAINLSKDLEDIYISNENLNGAINGDIVTVKYYNDHLNRGIRGEVIDVLERKKEYYYGKLVLSSKYGFVLVSDKKLKFDIYISKSNLNGAKNGDTVYVKITKGSFDGNSPEGKIIEVTNDINKVDILVNEAGISTDFNEEIINEAQNLSREISFENREDFTSKLVVTIDGKDAKDLDDAISLEVKDSNYILGVHIADVSHYVKEGSKIDEEALKRATSVYLVDRVIPMLPKELSNDLCSLNPGVDKYTLSITMVIDKNFNVIDSKIQKTVIRSKHRLNYEDLNKYYSSKDSLFLDDKKLTDMLLNMKKLSEKLREKRMNNGSIDFDFKETKVIVGEKIEIEFQDSGVSNSIIEEFMILANQLVSEEYFWREIPFVYRTHLKPDFDKIEELNRFVRALGYTIKGDKRNINPNELKKLIDALKGSKYFYVVNKRILRSLKQATYTKELIGHFGLGIRYYSHFTSPIRRYPDLQIHRIISDSILGRLTKSKIRHYDNIVAGVSKRSSELERVAERLERDVKNYYEALYLSDRIGEEFDAIVSGITSNFVFLQLDNLIEGACNINNLHAYYEYENDMLLVGIDGSMIQLGDRYRCELINVDLENIRIDFKGIGKIDEN